jgi:hypothetical protein
MANLGERRSRLRFVVWSQGARVLNRLRACGRWSLALLAILVAGIAIGASGHALAMWQFQLFLNYIPPVVALHRVVLAALGDMSTSRNQGAWINEIRATTIDDLRSNVADDNDRFRRTSVPMRLTPLDHSPFGKLRTEVAAPLGLKPNQNIEKWYEP